MKNSIVITQAILTLILVCACGRSSTTSLRSTPLAKTEKTTATTYTVCANGKKYTGSTATPFNIYSGASVYFPALTATTTTCTGIAPPVSTALICMNGIQYRATQGYRYNAGVFYIPAMTLTGTTCARPAEIFKNGFER